MRSSTSNTDNLIKGLSVQSVVTIVLAVLELIVFALLSRLLTKAEFGYCAVITGVRVICMSLSEAGLGSAIVQKKNADSKYISTAFTLSVIVGFTVAFLLFVLAPFLANLIADSTITNPLRLASLTVFLYSLNSVGNNLLYKKLNFKRVGINQTLSYFFASVIGVFLAAKGFGIYAAVLINVLNALFNFIMLYAFCVKIPKLGIDRTASKSIINFGGWLTASVIVNNITHQLDKLLLPKWLSVEDLGSYNRPAGFVSTATTKFGNVFDTVLFPMLSDLQDNPDKVKGVLRRSINLLSLCSAILATIFFFNAELIIDIFFGSQWTDLVPILQIVSLSIVFNFISRLVDCFFRSLALVKLNCFIRIGAAILTFFCIYIGSRFNITAVAVSVFLANLIIANTKLAILCHKVGTGWIEVIIPWLKSLIPSIPLIILGGVYLIAFNHSFVSNIIFAVIPDADAKTVTAR